MTVDLIFAIPVLISLIAGLGGWSAVHARAKTAYVVAFGLVLAASVGLYAAAVTAPGWDGLTYMLCLIFGSLPAAASMLVGGIVGVFTRKPLALPS